MQRLATIAFCRNDPWQPANQDMAVGLTGRNEIRELEQNP
jgi:hypothetical protein